MTRLVQKPPLQECRCSSVAPGMACPQCEWEIFQTGRYEPTRHGRRSSSQLTTRGSTSDLAPHIGGDHIATRIFRRRRSEIQEGLRNLTNIHTIKNLERMTGELIYRQENYEKSRQSLCRICSLDLRSPITEPPHLSPHYSLCLSS
jgi:hypothetical protein